MPQLGSGILVGSYGPFINMTALYLATYNATALAAPPTAKLGNTTTEPASATWTKLGVLVDDDFTVTTAQPTFVEDRRGFKKVLYARAINQAGSATFDTMMIESDPVSISKITGQATTALAAGGDKLQITYDQLYDRSVLLYNISAFDGSERYIFIPHAQVRWELAEESNKIWTIKVSIESLQYTTGGVNYLFEEGRFN